MNDLEIIELYFSRDEEAIKQTDIKYGKLCHSVAFNILNNNEDSEECVNDTYQAVWTSIPPNRPAILSTYLGKITRRICLKVLRNRDAQKRGNGELALSLEELHECISSDFDVDDTVGFKELVATINRFLSQLPISERRVFVLRYWHTYPIDTICEQLGCSKSKVESMLHRTRSKLRKQLIKEGYFL